MKLSVKLIIAVTLCALNVSVGWAQRQYPGSVGLPDDVVWMREIYRTLDLTKDTNGALYYPVEPQGSKMNLFTTMFRLLAQKKIPAYEYQLDGTERFQKDAEVTFREVLDRFQIYYEMKKVANRRDSVLSVNNSDIPSADVLSYFIKEVWYFDQRTSTYGSVITAVCPVLHRSEDFSSEKMTFPMFWVNYQDLVPYLTQSKISVSNYNNAANSTWEDFFTARLYKGDIYKTTNLQNRTLSQYCSTDSAMLKEQKRIEKELADFENTLYGRDLIEETDSLSATSGVKVAKSNSKKKGRDNVVTTKGKSSSSVKSKSYSGKSQSVSKREAAAPKASVRRQRR
ncbi:gliding motility protein GldN [uncultured Bacteroides sp.]|uniref:type IX secretion system ring protein PorN/GldN n=1 Tax=uncultured Bacteroides sp. TaxID=162156 RepID=UPI002600D73E|nr:gliding motility protein GldN [uncultured Bacteroides sp.]